MSVLITFLLGGLGGAIAFLLDLPIPWLVGSLLAMVILRKFSFIRPPNKKISRWMRVVLGVALGSSVAASLQSFNLSLIALIAACIVFVCFITACGYYYFQRIPSFSNVDAFMSALPGGLTFLMSLSDNMGDKFPKIALIHTIRMVFLILSFSVLAIFIGLDQQPEQDIIQSFALPFNPLLWQVFALTWIMGLVSDKLNIAGGHIMFPMIAAGVFYSQNWMSVPVPEIFQTLAMITFGVGIGCKLNSVEFGEFKLYIKKSLSFTVFAMAMAFVISLALGNVLDMHYFLLFLALAPGSIAEISLIALSLGFDVGLVALVHTCRYLFIMMIGSYGLHALNRPDETGQPPTPASV